MNRRSGIYIMSRLIVMVRPLLFFMCIAICAGVLGYLCAIFLPVVAGMGLLGIILQGGGFTGSLFKLSLLMALMALMRGVLRYIEQACNHYIAFRLLALIRHKVFSALRKLCPAKLEVRDKGDLIALITGDIELLEVFYAHTISPIAIAFIYRKISSALCLDCIFGLLFSRNRNSYSQFPKGSFRGNAVQAAVCTA